VVDGVSAGMRREPVSNAAFSAASVFGPTTPAASSPLAF
jgi:hypothetical protein